MSTTGNRPVIIYISAASDLMAERETLARMIAQLPVTLAWRVLQTPISEADQFEPLLLAEADLHLLILGGDIRAPVGLELMTARQTRRQTIAFKKRGVAQTTAANVFVGQSQINWRPFSNASDLSQGVRLILADFLIEHALRFALSPVEVEQLAALKDAVALNKAKVENESQPQSTNSEAGRSAVIFSPERFTPSDGILVDDKS